MNRPDYVRESFSLIHAANIWRFFLLCKYFAKKMQKTFIFGIKCAISHPKTIKNGIMNKTFLVVGTATFAILTVAIGTLIAKAQTAKTRLNTSTIDSLDISRYMGRWYELARFDHPFERNMELVTANYTLKPDGTVEVINSGYNTRRGKFKQSRGVARRVKGRYGELEVTFFLNFWSPYKVLELAPDYSYALVGSNSDKYLWILSRTPRLPSNVLSDILAMAEARGYDTDQLIWVEQN
jgi:lipocalin